MPTLFFLLLAWGASACAYSHPHATLTVHRHRNILLSSSQRLETGTAGLKISYGGAALGLAASALRLVPEPTGMNRAVLASTALAMVCDFGPSAIRDVSNSIEAKNVAVSELLDAMPPMVLVDNFVNNLGPRDEEREERKRLATKTLESVNKWGTLVRSRVLADALGVLIMLRGHACLGAGFSLAAHATCWAKGAAAARLTPLAEAAPLSPPLARLIGATTAMLAFAAITGAYGRSVFLRLAGGWAYAISMTAIQSARVVADVVRNRTHVGI